MDGQAVDGLRDGDPPLPDPDLPKCDWHDVYLMC